MLKQLLVIGICASLYISAFAEDIPLGDWRTHFSYAEGQGVERVGSKIYSVASGSLYAYDLDDNSIQIFTKKDGLNDIGINLIRYSESYNTLIICYENGNIDLLKDQKVWNVPDIKMKSTTGSKRINEVCFNGAYAYLASDLGAIVFNLERREIKETYLLAAGGAQNIVYDVTFYNGSIYAATNNGLFMAAEDEPVLMNFANWEYETMIPEYNQTYRFVRHFGEHLIAVRSDGATATAVTYAYVSGQWNRIGNGYSLGSVRISEGLMTFSYRTAFLIYNKELKIHHTISSVFSADGDEKVVNSVDGICIDSLKYAVVSPEHGLMLQLSPDVTTFASPDGPSSNTVWDIDISTSGVRVVPGKVTGSWNNSNTSLSVSTYKDGLWSFFDKDQIPEFDGKRDFIDVQSDPLDPEHYFVASYGNGLFEFQGDALVKIHDASNSPITDIFNGDKYMRLNSLVFDQNNKLWFTNAEVNSSVHALASDGSWESFAYTDIDNIGEKVYVFGSMIITLENTKWLILPKRLGLYVFNEEQGETAWIKSIQDSETGDLISNLAISMVQDQDGSIWVGTSNGIAIFYNPEQVFENKDYFPASRIKLPRLDEEEDEGLADYLLDGEPISALAVDGGNRKWIGTSSSGVFLVSADGQDVIHHFTVENSMLPSNSIRRLAIDPTNGEVFIATGSGLVSYRSDATSSEQTFDNIKVFPNPVREDFNGTISISGLVDQTNVKITDVSGNLVYETVSNGGTASWDAKNFYGDRVGTGVYLIFCSNQDGSLSEMTKILVVNNK